MHVRVGTSKKESPDQAVRDSSDLPIALIYFNRRATILG